jgi:hypothetical protein
MIRAGWGVLVALVAITYVLAIYFCLLISDTHTKTVQMHAMMTEQKSARDAQIDRGHDDNAANISANTNRLEALENRE